MESPNFLVWLRPEAQLRHGGCRVMPEVEQRPGARRGPQHRAGPGGDAYAIRSYADHRAIPGPPPHRARRGSEPPQLPLHLDRFDSPGGIKASFSICIQLGIRAS